MEKRTNGKNPLDDLISNPDYKPREDGTETPLYIISVDQKQREHLIELLNPEKAYQNDVEFIEEWYEEDAVETKLEPGIYQANLRIESHRTNAYDEPEEWDSWIEWGNTKKYKLELFKEKI